MQYNWVYGALCFWLSHLLSLFLRCFCFRCRCYQYAVVSVYFFAYDRRFKRDVLASLPPKKRFVVRVQIESKETAATLQGALEALHKLDGALHNAVRA